VKADPVRHNTCNAIQCRAAIPAIQVFCATHRAMVSLDTSKALDRHFRLRSRPSQLFRVAVERARREILYYQQNGHQAPVDRLLQW
jgi:hypothetical protein